MVLQPVKLQSIVTVLGAIILGLGSLILIISYFFDMDPRIPLGVSLTWLVSLLLFLSLRSLYEGIKGIYKREMTLIFLPTPTQYVKGYYGLFWGIIYIIISIALFVLIGFILFLLLSR